MQQVAIRNLWLKTGQWRKTASGLALLDCVTQLCWLPDSHHLSQVMVTLRHSRWRLGIKLWSSVTAMIALNPRVLSPALSSLAFKLFFFKEASEC